MLGHKLSLGKFKKMKIISNIFPDHNTMILEIQYKKKKKNSQKHKYMATKPYATKQHWITEEIKEETKNAWRQIKTTV